MELASFGQTNNKDRFLAVPAVGMKFQIRLTLCNRHMHRAERSTALVCDVKP